jgi:hypothetical protein
MDPQTLRHTDVMLNAFRCMPCMLWLGSVHDVCNQATASRFSAPRVNRGCCPRVSKVATADNRGCHPVQVESAPATSPAIFSAQCSIDLADAPGNCRYRSCSTGVAQAACRIQNLISQVTVVSYPSLRTMDSAAASPARQPMPAWLGQVSLWAPPIQIEAPLRQGSA